MEESLTNLYRSVYFYIPAPLEYIKYVDVTLKAGVYVKNMGKVFIGYQGMDTMIRKV